jgi:hypothetical protein
MWDISGGERQKKDQGDHHLRRRPTELTLSDLNTMDSHVEYTNEEWLMIRRRACQELRNKFGLDVGTSICFHGYNENESKFMVGMYEGDYDAYSLMAATSPLRAFAKRTLRSLFPIQTTPLNVSILEDTMDDSDHTTFRNVLSDRETGNSPDKFQKDRSSGRSTPGLHRRKKPNVRQVAIAQVSVFGTPLAWSLRKCGVPHGPFRISLPSPIEKSLEVLQMPENMGTPNLFRKKGNKKVIRDLKALCETDPTTSFVAKYIFEKEEIPTVYDVVGVLKVYLKELPETLFTQLLMPHFLRITGECHSMLCMRSSLYGSFMMASTGTFPSFFFLFYLALFYVIRYQKSYRPMQTTTIVACTATHRKSICSRGACLVLS